MVKNPPANAGGARDSSSIPWSRKGQPAPIFLPGKFHGQRSLVGNSSWVTKSWEFFVTSVGFRHSNPSLLNQNLLWLDLGTYVSNKLLVLFFILEFENSSLGLNAGT